jgi:hypothetical protein
MPKRHDRKGRSTTEPFVRLPQWMLHSAAWRALSAVERCVLIEILAIYNGHNNGRLALSARDAGKRVGCSKNTAARAFDELRKKGFIDVATPGGFSRKTPHATEYRLTLYQCDRTGERPSKAFARWHPQLAVEDRTRSHPRDSQSHLRDSSHRCATKLPVTVPPVTPPGPN